MNAARGVELVRGCRPGASRQTVKAAQVSGGRAHRRRGFAAATISLVAVFAASGSPIPLYERYRVADHLSTADLSLAAVVYFVGAIGALLVLGRLSDHLGRRPMAIAAVGLAAAGALVLLDVGSLAPLLVGRFLHGVACGLASTALTSYVVDTAPPRPCWLPAATTAGAPLAGLTIGALSAGILVQYGPHRLQLTYLLVIAFLAVCAGLLIGSPETVARRGGARASLRPRVAIPARVRPLMPTAAVVFVSTWALGGFYQAFSPTVSAQALGTSSTLVAAVVFASFMAPNAIGGPLTGRLPAATAQRLGMLVFAAAIIVVVVSLHAGSTLGVIAASLVAGAAQGAAFTGTMRGLLNRTHASERAGLLAAVYAISYSGAAIPGLIAGRAAAHLGLVQVAAGYAALALAAAVAVVVLTTASGAPEGAPPGHPSPPSPPLA